MGLEEALILLYLLVDDAYRIVTFGGRLRPGSSGSRRYGHGFLYGGRSIRPSFRRKTP
jgi:hypothetical protein